VIEKERVLVFTLALSRTFKKDGRMEEEFEDTPDLDRELMLIEEAQSDDDESNETPPSDIVAFNELRSCSDLKRLKDAKQLQIQPDFQREDVWQATQQTRFIDSLAKQLPIPSMCISLDYKTDKRQMVDGLQRMSSIIKFLSDDSWRLSKLDDIDPRISNKTVAYIKENNPEIYSRVENTVIPVTVLRCDLAKRSHQEYLFTIFHRLNTGGMKLNNQEIRNCIYSGKFNEMLKEVAWSPASKSLFGLIDGKKYRFSTEELLLRFLAFSEDLDKYKRPLPKFLNNYMDKCNRLGEALVVAKKTVLERALKVVYEKALGSEPLPRLSKATIEALFVGVIKNLDQVEAMTNDEVARRYQALRVHGDFSVESLKEGLSEATKVTGRLNTATGIFGAP
jgi:hypothetical protein